MSHFNASFFCTLSKRHIPDGIRSLWTPEGKAQPRTRHETVNCSQDPIPCIMTHEAKNACLFICMSGSGKARNAHVRLSGHQQGSKGVVSKERAGELSMFQGEQEPASIPLF